MADPYDMLAVLRGLVTSVPDLKDRFAEVADLSELIRQGKLPANPVTAFGVPLGLRPRGDGDAGAGAYTQSIDEWFGVVLVLRTANDATGAKTLPRLNRLVWAVIGAVAGGDADDAIGVFTLRRGELMSLNAGLIIYRLDFSIQLQLRNL